MTIPEEKLDEFIGHYAIAFPDDPITRDEAQAMLTQLVELYRGLIDYARFLPERQWAREQTPPGAS